ncbi:MAG: hypothetical protein II842_18720 [Butyrivibrio sp.]|nr:hypothetical protein [Butyrivibrio sp.]
MQSIKENGLTGFNLKYLALIFMVLDHFHYFFEFTGKIPIVFTWIGRLAAPLFLFCFVEGFIHTHDRKKYFLRIYLISVVMGAIQFGFYNVLSWAVRGDGFFPINAMLSSFSVLFVVMQGLDWIRQKKIVPGIIAFVLPWILPYLMSRFVFQPLMNAGNNMGLFLANLVSFTVLPLHTNIIDGGTLTLLGGTILLFYSYFQNKKIRIFAWGIFMILWNGLGPFFWGRPLSVNTLFFESYDWMGVFSIIFMLFYNGERGKGNAKLFYWFYPVHVYVLYGLSVVVYILTIR